MVFGTDEVANIRELDQIKEDFVFLFVGHWLQGDLGEDRKNVGMMIKTFAMAFKDEKVKPALVLKTSSAGFSVIDRENMIKKIKHALGKDFGKVPVYLLHGDMADYQLNGLYEHPKVKAMLNFTKGEGFGRPLLEFSLTGKPVIASNWSGHLDFLKTGAVLLDGELKDVAGGQELVGDKRRDSLLKELDKQSPKMEALDSDPALTSTRAGERTKPAQTTNQLPQGTTSPMGTHKPKLPPIKGKKYFAASLPITPSIIPKVASEMISTTDLALSLSSGINDSLALDLIER